MILISISTIYSLIFLHFQKYVPKIRTVNSLLNATLLTSYSLILYYQHGTLMLKNNDIALNDILTGYFLYDAVTGFFLDRQQFNLITGLAHHVIYITLLRYLRFSELSHLIYPFLPFEAPTMLMDINKLHKSPFADNSFGVTFFMTRILYNIQLAYTFYEISPYYGLIVFSMLCVHIAWFKRWVERRFFPENLNNRII